MRERRPDGVRDNVISFERSAAFLHGRAIKNRATQPIDALELLRSALVKDPDNPEYRIDMAELYYEMGCYLQSALLLSEVLGTGEYGQECYFGLGLNFLAMGCIDGARSAITKYIELAPGGEYCEEAVGLLSQITLAEVLVESGDRRSARAVRMAERGRRAFARGDMIVASERLARALDIDPRLSRVRVMRAEALLRLGRKREAAREALAAAGEKAPDDVICATAILLKKLGLPSRAALRAALLSPDSDFPAGAIIEMYTELGWYGRAAEVARRVHSDFPHDTAMLSAEAATILNDGGDVGRALPYWRLALIIDPEDPVSAYWLSRASDRANDIPVPIPVIRGYPPDARGEFERILSGDRGEAERAGEARVRAAADWGLRGSHPVEAIALLEGVEDRWAESALRRGLMIRELPGHIKFRIADVLAARGARPPYVALVYDDMVLMGGEARPAARIGPEAYTALMRALEKGRDGLLTEAKPLVDAWAVMVSSGLTPRRTMRSANGCAAALLITALASTDGDYTPGEVIRAFDVGQRVVMRYIRMLGRAGRIVGGRK